MIHFYSSVNKIFIGVAILFILYWIFDDYNLKHKISDFVSNEHPKLLDRTITLAITFII